MKTLRLTLAIAAAFVAFPALAENHGDIDRVNKSIEIGSGDSAGELETVNGSIEIGSNATVKSAETVNGSVSLGAGSVAEYLETVNGSISLEADATVAQNVEAVNGRIELESNAEVIGDVENVNGGIELNRAKVGGTIKTTTGDVFVLDGSRVDGGILIEQQRNSWFNNSQPARDPRVVIGAGSVVNGELRFEREVDLYVHESAKVGTITGANAKRYDSADLPSFVD
jgi:hypothetical protein